MKNYSDFFKTLHDETKPTGFLGRGTHYSILRAVVWHDQLGNPLPSAHYLDFAVIWDEDHDDRIIEAIEKMYVRGLLSSVTFIGERKGTLNVIPDDNFLQDASNDQRLQTYREEIQAVSQSLSDPWSSEVDSLNKSSIISDGKQRVTQYLDTLKMLWELGVNPIRK